MGALFAGLDVSQATTAICVVDKDGVRIFETETATTPMAIAVALRPYRRLLSKVGHETGDSASWLHKALTKRKFPMVSLDARRTRAALSAQRNKTDRNDARDIALLLSRGLEAEIYVKSDEAEHLRILLTYRSALRRRARDLVRTLTGTLRSMEGTVSVKQDRICVSWDTRRYRDPGLAMSADAMVRAHASMMVEANTLDELVRRYAHEDAVCQRLMTAPGVGPVIAVAFKAAIDDPSRFKQSRVVGAYFGLTPRRRQSGRSDFSTGISKFGDREVRASLYLAAQVLLSRSKSECDLRVWGLKLKARKGARLAYAAVARKFAIILHRMWVTERDFRSVRAKA